MRLLLDEDTAPGLEPILRELGHEVDRVSGSVLYAGAPDHEVVEFASAYDALITKDIHRESRAWEAANQAMLAGTPIVRMRFPGSLRGDLFDQLRTLIWKWPQWEIAIVEQDARLVTITGLGTHIRIRTTDEVRDMFAAYEGLQAE